MRLRIPVLILATAAVAAVSASLPADAMAQRRVVRPYFYDSWYVGYPWYAGYGYRRGYYYDLGASMRLQVTPRDTEVFVDGYYAGRVDDFDGVLQRLNLEPGEHDVELFLPGHRSLVERVYLQPGKTTRIRHSMQPLAAGEPEPVKPSGSSNQAITPVRRGPDRVEDSGENRGADRGPDRRPDREPANAPRARRTPRDDAADMPASKPSRPESYGALSVRVQPGAATILIDGERWEGAAGDDRLVVELSPGRHVIDVQKEGYRQYTTEVTVKPGETATLNIALTRN